METIALTRQAEREVRALPVASRRQLQRSLGRLAAGQAGLDIKPLAGRGPWKRLRVGDYRVLYRTVDAAEHPTYRWLVARVVNRRDLERAVQTL